MFLIFNQAILHVIKACVEQADAITEALREEGLPPYQLTDLLPTHIFNSPDQKERYALGEGTVRYKHSLGTDYSGFSALAKVVWEDRPTVFGSLVSSLRFIIYTIANLS